VPICNTCGKPSNASIDLPCEHCGAKYWAEGLHDKTLREHGERYAQSKSARRVTDASSQQHEQPNIARKASESSSKQNAQPTTEQYAQPKIVRHASSSSDGLSGCLIAILGIAGTLGFLWLVIFIVKWMWNHS